MHLNKGQSTTLLNRVSGSIAWTGAARSVLIFERDPEDPESDQRVIVHAKCNVGPYADTLACRIEQRSGKDAKGKAFVSSKIVITGTSTVTAGDLAGGRGDDRRALDDAIAFLADELANGPKSARAIKSASQDAGLAWRTVERAKKPLGIESFRNSAEGWEWRLGEDRQPFGGVPDGGLGGVPEKPVNTGDSGDGQREDRQPQTLAVLPEISDFMHARTEDSAR